MLKRRFILAVVCLLVAASAMAQVRVRKHIDELSATELDAFAKAIDHLKRLPASDPNAYIKWADIHGKGKPFAPMGGPCEHNSEVIWAWHRAYLLAFEDVLRATIPGVTDNVTIPYWNWTEPPSGQRYPIAFETRPELSVAACPVGNVCRNTTAHASSPLDPALIASIQAIGTWADYGGRPKATGGGKGTLEAQAHDTIHGTYIGGSNSTPVTAARDPLFWAHHAYMDWLWAQWQDAHPGTAFDPVCLTCPINFLPGKVVRDYLDIRILNYRYQPRVAPGGLEAMMATPRRRRARSLMIEIPTPPSVVEVPLTLPPASTLANATLIFREISVPTDASYLVRVYARRAPADPSTRSESNLLVFFTQWRTEAEHATHDHGGTTDVRLNVTARLQELIRGAPPSARWVLQVEVLRADEGANLTPARFGEPFRWDRIEVEVTSAPVQTVR